ncbi:unnamed protein product, partial [Prorocentrum cordatum]
PRPARAGTQCSIGMGVGWRLRECPPAPEQEEARVRRRRRSEEEEEEEEEERERERESGAWSEKAAGPTRDAGKNTHGLLGPRAGRARHLEARAAAADRSRGVTPAEKKKKDNSAENLTFSFPLLAWAA